MLDLLNILWSYMDIVVLVRIVSMMFVSWSKNSLKIGIVAVDLTKVSCMLASRLYFLKCYYFRLSSL